MDSNAKHVNKYSFKDMKKYYDKNIMSAQDGIWKNSARAAVLKIHSKETLVSII